MYHVSVDAQNALHPLIIVHNVQMVLISSIQHVYNNALLDGKVKIMYACNAIPLVKLAQVQLKPIAPRVIQQVGFHYYINSPV